MKKALVFGANGYIGRHLVYFLGREGYEVIPCDVDRDSIDDLDNYIACDITLTDELCLLDFDVDYLFAFAGLTGTARGFKDYHDFVRINEIGLLNILNEVVEQQSSARIIFPSTRLVYKGIKGTPLTEDSEKEAKTVYAQNKLSCESYLGMYHNYHDVDYTIFRICVPYGNLFDDTYSYGTVGYFLSKAKEGEDIMLYGDGSLMRTFTYIEDICYNIIEGMQAEGSKNEVFNIGGDDLSLREAAEMIAKQYGIGIGYSEWPEVAEALESGDTIFDSSRLDALTDRNIRHKLSDWIRYEARNFEKK